MCPSAEAADTRQATFDASVARLRPLAEGSASRVSAALGASGGLHDGGHAERAHERAGRVSAVLSLKANTERAQSDVQAANARRAAARAARATTRDARAGDLLLDGQNPHEVFRVADRDAHIQRTMASFTTTVAQSQVRRRGDGVVCCVCFGCVWLCVIAY